MDDEDLLPDLREPRGLDGVALRESLGSLGAVPLSSEQLERESLDEPRVLPDVFGSDRETMDSNESDGADSAAESTVREPRTKLGRMRKAKRRRSSKDLRDISPTSIASVYTNLVITEDALRNQYIELQTYRRKNIVFFWAVLLAALYLTYLNILSPSIYQWINFLELLGSVTAFISLILFYLTGLYNRVFFTTPRYISDANKGMRAYNIRLVKIPTTWKEKLFRLVDPVYSEQVGGLVKLVPSARVFSPHFIETWEVYRQEVWEKRAREVQRSSAIVKPALEGDTKPLKRKTKLDQ